MPQADESLITGIMDAQPEPVIWFRPVYSTENKVENFTIYYCNQATAHILKMNKNDIIGKNVQELGALDNVSVNILEECFHVWETGEPYEFTFHNKNTGRYFNVLRSKVLDGIISIARDITEVMNAQQKAKQQAELLRSILNASLNPVFACEAIRNENGKITDLLILKANSMLLQLVERSHEQIIRKTWTSAFAPGEHKQVYDLVLSVIENREPLREEISYQSDTNTTWFDFSIAPLGDNGAVVSFTDITQIKKDREAILASAKYLQEVIDSSQTGITVIQPVYENGLIEDFRYKVVNYTFSKYVGKSPADLVGALLSKWFPLYKAQGTFDRYKKIFETGEPARFDLHYVKDGYDVWVDVMAKKDGEEIMVTFHDYTPLKKAQLAQEALVNDLKRSNANLEDFAFAASHDLQEPLRKIHFFAHRIRTSYADVLGEEGMDMFNRMEIATHRMRDLIDDLLEYSQTAQKPREQAANDLNEIVTEVISDLEPVINEKKAQITSDKLPVINGDGQQLRQLFQNLLSNALKYTHPERTPFISLRADIKNGRESGFKLASENFSRKYHFIEITDNGIGFKQEDADKIFNVFQRLHGKNEYRGTGVGLAIVKKVVENHDGCIMAHAQPGEGATFRILLPVENQTESPNNK
jgi:signal transduction histidine kinase